jgi:transposase
VRRSYKFLLRPTRKQEAALGACLEDTRQLYNAALEERREAWRKGRHRVTFYSQDAQLKDIRAENPERYGRWSFTCERAAVRRLDRAFQAFFRRVKAGEKPGYPRFKGRGWWDSIEWPDHGTGGYEPNGVAAKAALNKSILDAGWGIFLRILTAKAESAGRTVIAIDPRHTSQRCARCGHTAAGNRVIQAEFLCLACGHQAHADVNAAVNILRAGLALQEAHQAA